MGAFDRQLVLLPLAPEGRGPTRGFFSVADVGVAIVPPGQIPRSRFCQGPQSRIHRRPNAEEATTNHRQSTGHLTESRRIRGPIFSSGGGQGTNKTLFRPRFNPWIFNYAHPVCTQSVSAVWRI